MIYEQIAWYLPIEKPLPDKLCSVLVKLHGGIVYAGTWSPGSQTVVLFPEDLSPVKVAEIELWAKFPKGHK